MAAKRASKRRQKDAQDDCAAGATSQHGLQASDMAAPNGNQFWKARAKDGRDLIFTNPETLWKACCEYFEWAEANPLFEDRLFSYQGEVVHEPAAKMRAMTLDGLCIFLDVSFQTWLNYKNREDFLDIIGRVENIICVQKFTGAAAGLLNPNVIARDLGLAGKQDIGIGCQDGGPIKYERIVFEIIDPRDYPDGANPEGGGGGDGVEW